MEKNGLKVALTVYLVSPLMYSAYLTRDHHQVESMCKCVTTIAEEYFRWSRLIVISLPAAPQQNTQLGNCITRNLNLNNVGPLFISLNNETVSYSELFGNVKASVYILLTNVEELQKSFRFRVLELKAQPVWNARAKVVVTVSGKVESDVMRDVPRDMLAELWRERAIDAVVLIEAAPVHATYVRQINYSGHVPLAETGALELHAWFPYQGIRCGGPVLHTSIIDLWLGEEFLHCNNLFSNKMPSDLHGCPVVISAVVWEPYVFTYNGTSEEVQATVGAYNFTVQHIPYSKGTDISIIREISARMNFQSVFRPPPPGQWNEVFSDLQEGRSEVAVGLLLGTVPRYKTMDPTTAFAWEILACWVPPPKPIPRWMSIKRVLSPKLWMYVFLAQLVSCLAFWALSLHRESDMFKSLTKIPFTTMSIILSISVPQHPHFWSLKMFFVLFTIYCLLISTAFQTGLFSILAEPGYIPSIRNLDELLASGLQFGLIPAGARHFVNSDNPKHSTVLKNFVDCSDMDACLDRLAFRGDFCVFTGQTHVEYLRNIRYVRHGKHLMTTTEEYINKNEQSLFLIKGSLLLEEFNLYISSMLQGGLIDKIKSDYLRTTGQIEKRATGKDKVEVLTLVHLEAPFMVWGAGLFLSTVALLCEVTWSRYVGQLVLQTPLRSKAISCYGCALRWLRCKQLEIPVHEEEETGA